MSGPVSDAEGHYKLNELSPHKFDRLARQARMGKGGKRKKKKKMGGDYSGGISA